MYLIDNRMQKIACQDQILKSFLFYYTLVLLGTCFLPLKALDALLLILLSLMVAVYFYKKLLEVLILVESCPNVEGWQFITVHLIYYHYPDLLHEHLKFIVRLVITA